MGILVKLFATRERSDYGEMDLDRLLNSAFEALPLKSCLAASNPKRFRRITNWPMSGVCIKLCVGIGSG